MATATSATMPANIQKAVLGGRLLISNILRRQPGRAADAPVSTLFVANN